MTGDRTPHPQAQQELAALRATFAAGLEERVAAIRALGEQLAETPDEAGRAVLTSLHALAHKLAGSAGTFGFEELGRAAWKLEEECQALLDHDGPPAAADRSRLADRAAALVPLVHTADEEEPPLAPEADEMSATILVVEDDPPQLDAYRTFLRDTAYRVITADTGRNALARLDEQRIDAVLLDLSLPDLDGLEILRRIAAAEEPRPCVIVITARGSVATAVEAMRLGAFDFVVKPFNAARLLVTLHNGLQHGELARKAAAYDSLERSEYCGFVGASPAMQAVYRTIDSAAASKATVFITGESGTGKELCALAIHSRGPRSTGPFIALNCSAIPHELMESEIFGHTKGAFTGAVADRQGAAGRADGGTLFLDEICEMDLALQAKLLRFLQTGSFEPVGGSSTKAVDVRIVCATNRDPRAEVAAGRFREDLYYRLHVIPIHLPPLRDRGDDVLQLARRFLHQYTAEEGKSFRRFAPATERRLTAYTWPGNVRQLQNAVRNLVVLNDGEEATPDMLPAEMGEALPAAPATPANPATPAGGDPAPAAIRPLAQVEREAIERALALCDGDVARAAHHLGIHASTIYRRKTAWEDEA